MDIAGFAIRKKTVTLVLTAAIAVGGVVSFMGLGQLEDPEFTIFTAIVQTSYPGASPEEVELEVTDRLETVRCENALATRLGPVWTVMRRLATPERLGPPVAAGPEASVPPVVPGSGSRCSRRNTQAAKASIPSPVSPPHRTIIGLSLPNASPKEPDRTATASMSAGSAATRFRYRPSRSTAASRTPAAACTCPTVPASFGPSCRTTRTVRTAARVRARGGSSSGGCG